MALEVAQGNQDICVHESSSDQCRLTILSVHNLYFHIIRSSQTVCDDDMASRCDGIESVDLRAGQMIDRVRPAARIQCIAVRQEWNTTKFPDQISHSPDIIRPEIGAVSKLAKMHLDRDILFLKIDFPDSCRPTKLLKFCTLADTFRCTEIRIEYFCFFHFLTPAHAVTIHSQKADDFRDSGCRLSIAYFILNICNYSAPPGIAHDPVR